MSQITRRPMTVALQSGNDLPAEALALIREGTPKPKTPLPIVSPIGDTTSTIKATEKADTPSIEPTKLAESASKDESAEREAQRGSISKQQKVKEQELIASNALVSMTFRVPTDLPGALLRASADRKARRIRPFTQQEILTEALSQWLKRNGYV